MPTRMKTTPVTRRAHHSNCDTLLNVPPTAFALTAVMTIGRGAHNSVALPSDKHVSNNHALVFVRDGVIHVRDRGSTNGTYVNGARIDDETPLNDGDRITVGTTVLRYSAQQAAVALSVEDGDA